MTGMSFRRLGGYESCCPACLALFRAVMVYAMKFTVGPRDTDAYVVPVVGWDRASGRVSNVLSQTETT